ncbi:MAG: hypothetical protein HZB98_16490, partial [Bacteroidia bacterium]|nr:hypothetical protein [Bacteroidia bacterium]
MKDTRRNFIRQSASLAAAASLTGIYSCSGADKKEKVPEMTGSERKDIAWPVKFGPDKPKMCLWSTFDKAYMRKLKQIGVDYVISGGPGLPWTKEKLKEYQDAFNSEGLTVINLMIGGFDKAIYGRDGRDEEINKVKESLVAAGAVGLPIVEYNFYAHRFTDGYYDTTARG